MRASTEQFSADCIRWEMAANLGPDLHNLDIAEIVIVALEEAQSYRMLAQHAIHLLHVQNIQLKQQRNRHQRLSDQFRRDRAQRRTRKARAAR